MIKKARSVQNEKIASSFFSNKKILLYVSNFSVGILEGIPLLLYGIKRGIKH